MPNFVRAYCDEEKTRGTKPGEPIRFVISTEGIKRDGKDLRAVDWVFENYRKNPVVLWAHDYFGRNLPIGRGAPGQDGETTFADIIFDQEDEFAKNIESKYRRGFLNAVSVGWEDRELRLRQGLSLIDGGSSPRHRRSALTESTRPICSWDSVRPIAVLFWRWSRALTHSSGQMGRITT